jgi:hypothetical protein
MTMIRRRFHFEMHRKRVNPERVASMIQISTNAQVNDIQQYLPKREHDRAINNVSHGHDVRTTIPNGRDIQQRFRFGARDGTLSGFIESAR